MAAGSASTSRSEVNRFGFSAPSRGCARFPLSSREENRRSADSLFICLASVHIGPRVFIVARREAALFALSLKGRVRRGASKNEAKTTGRDAHRNPSRLRVPAC